MSDAKEVSFKVTVKDAATAALKQIEHASESAREKLFSLKDVMHELVGAIAAFSVVEIVKDMIDLGVAADATFRQIAATLPTANEGMAELKERVADLAKESGRSLEAMQASAAGIARLGVASAEELGQQLKAATLLADGTGHAVDEVAPLLIQLRREFHLTGDEALKLAANLASATYGKADVTELLSSFQRASPMFNQLNIDAETGIKAIVSLIAVHGLSARQVGAEINKLDGAGIRQLASEAKISADALQQLETRADGVRDGVDRMNERMKNELKGTLEEIGTTSLPLVRDILANISELLKDIASRRIDKFLGVDGLMNLGKDRIHQDAQGGPFGGTNHGSSGSWGDEEAAPKPKPLPMSKADKDAAAAAALAEAKLAVALEQEAIAAERATQKTLDLAKAQGDTLMQAIDQTLGTLTGGLAQAAADAIDERARKLSREIILNESLSVAQKERYTNEVMQIRMIEQAKELAKPDLARAKETVTAALIPGNNAEAASRLARDQLALLADQRRYNALGLDDKEIKLALLEIDKKRAEVLKQMLGISTQDTANAKQRTADIRAQAQALQQAVDGAIQLGEAFGVVGRTLGESLRSIGQIVAGVAPLLDQINNLGKSDAQGNALASIGSVIGAALPVIGGLSTLIGSMGETPSQQAAKKVIEDNTAALRALTLKAQTLTGSGGTGRTAYELVQGLLNGSHGSIVNMDFGHGAHANGIGGLSPEEMDQLTAAAKSAGITLDGTRASVEALAKALPLLQVQFDAQQLQLQQDYQVRALRADGFATEADRLALAEAQEREYQKVRESGATDATLAALKFAQAAEAAKAAADATKAAADAARAAAESALASSLTDGASALSIHNDTNATDAFAAKAKAYQGAGGALGGLFAGFDLSKLNPADIAALDASVQSLFDKLAASPESVDLAGLSIDDLKKALLDLNTSAQAVAAGVETAAAKMSAAESKLSADFNILGTDAKGQAGAYADLYGFDLSQFDLSTAAGKDGATKYLQDLYRAHPELSHQIENTLGAIRNIQLPADVATAATAATGGSTSSGGGSTSAVASAFQALTTVQGDRMADVLLRSLDVQTDIRDALVNRVGVGLPSLVGFAGAAQAAGAGGGSVYVTVGDIHVTTDKEDAAAQGADAADAFAARLRELDVAFGRKTNLQKVYTGSIAL